MARIASSTAVLALSCAWRMSVEATTRRFSMRWPISAHMPKQGDDQRAAEHGDVDSAGAASNLLSIGRPSVISRRYRCGPRTGRRAPALVLDLDADPFDALVGGGGCREVGRRDVRHGDALPPIGAVGNGGAVAVLRRRDVPAVVVVDVVERRPDVGRFAALVSEDRRAVGIAVGLHHDFGHQLIGHAGGDGAVADRIGTLGRGAERIERGDGHETDDHRRGDDLDERQAVAISDFGLRNAD